MNSQDRRNRTILLIVLVMATALTIGATIGIAARYHANQNDTQSKTLCHTKTVPSDTAGTYGVTQAAIKADRDYPLYAFDGVSDEPRPVGILGKGEQFCFKEDAPVIDVSAEDPAGNSSPIGLIATKNWPDGVYSPAAEAIPTIKRGDSQQRIILMHFLTAAHGDMTRAPQFMYPPVLGQRSTDVSALTDPEVLALRDRG